MKAEDVRKPSYRTTLKLVYLLLLCDNYFVNVFLVYMIQLCPSIHRHQFGSLSLFCLLLSVL